MRGSAAALDRRHRSDHRMSLLGARGYHRRIVRENGPVNSGNILADSEPSLGLPAPAGAAGSRRRGFGNSGTGAWTILRQPLCSARTVAETARQPVTRSRLPIAMSSEIYARPPRSRTRVSGNRCGHRRHAAAACGRRCLAESIRSSCWYGSPVPTNDPYSLKHNRADIGFAAGQGARCSPVSGTISSVIRSAHHGWAEISSGAAPRRLRAISS